MLNNPYGNVAIVTGASSGIGASVARLLFDNGFTVYGGSRRGVVCTEGVKPLRLDVTDDASVKSAVKQAISEQGCVDILVNCAGTGIAGAVEDCSGGDALAQMNTNYAGTLRMIAAVLPSMRKNRRGLIVNIGSVGGIYSIPFQTLYSSSKAAVEALTEGLRIELLPYNVKATVIEPGDVKTGFTAARMYASGCPGGVSEYGEPFTRSIHQMEHDEQSGMPPESIAAAVVKAITKKNPPVRTVVGFQYKFFVFLKRLFPTRLVESILTSMYPNSSIDKK